MKGQIISMHEFIRTIYAAHAAPFTDGGYLCFIAQDIHGRGAMATMHSLLQESYPGRVICLDDETGIGPMYEESDSGLYYAHSIGIMDDRNIGTDQMRTEFLKRLLHQPDRRLFIPHIEEVK